MRGTVGGDKSAVGLYVDESNGGRVVFGRLKSGIAVGSFCPFGDGGEGREGFGFGVGLGGGGKGIAEGAVGLEGAELAEGAEEGALGAGVVAGQAEDDGFGFVGGERIGAGGQAGFEAADAAEVPGGEDELVEQVLLEHALGLEVVLVGGEEVVEFLAFLRGDDDLAGGEAVFTGVLTAASLALGSLGTGGQTSVGLVRLEATWGRHNYLRSSKVRTGRSF